jgi:hypothetical protein
MKGSSMATSTKPPSIWLVVFVTCIAVVVHLGALITLALESTLHDTSLTRFLPGVLSEVMMIPLTIFVWVQYFRRYVAYQIDQRFAGKASDA